MTFFAAADPLTSLVFLVVVALFSLISSWLKKRRGQEAETETEAEADEVIQPKRRMPSQPAAPSQPARATTSWEEEIRRLLEGDIGGKPPVTPPPVLIESAPRPAPPPVTRPRPQATREEEAITPLPVPPIFSRPGQTEETEAHELHPRTHMAGVPVAATLPAAAAAHERASRLHEAVAAHMGSMDSRTSTANIAPRTVKSRAVSAEATAILAMLKNPRSARQVIIATAVLGSPKGLEN